tara:strand:+ start:763 stop:1416 length:654 start_codon:yes stop_codon:yes gene_type:complete
MLNKIKNFLLRFLLSCILNSILMTCSWKTKNKDIFDLAHKQNRPIFLCCWHSRFILIASYFKKIKLSIWSISSTHKDSEMIAGILKNWGLSLIRGSSTRGWSHVIKQLMKVFKNKNSVVAITNDGPKGPPMVAKRGSVMLAIKNNAQIIAISAEASNYWTIPSWDRTIIPKPFSTIYVKFSEQFKTKQVRGKEEELVSSFISENYYSLIEDNKVDFV